MVGVVINADQLHAIMPFAKYRVEAFIDALVFAMAKYDINTPLRIAAFIAQCAHESGELQYMREIASGALYEGRTDLGNTQPGDGPLYRGRTLLMITGRANYTHCEAAIGLPVIANPQLLELVPGATLGAAWFWQSSGFNNIADSDRFGTLTKRLNGGYNGLDSRLTYFWRARKAFGL